MKDFLKMVLGSCLGVVLASLLVMFIFFAMVGAAIGSFVDGFSSDKKTKPVKPESLLLLDLKGPVGETSAINPFVSYDSEEKRDYTLPEIIKALEVAKEEPDVEAVVLNLEEAQLNFATAKELRDALRRVQQTGKKVYAYSDHYSYLNYYVSSVADRVMGGPEGSLNITGLTSNTLFTKGLQKKLGVEIQVFKVGTFKGAVEPFILDGLSEANRLQISEYLSGLWQGTISEMAASRGVEPALFQQFADEAMFLDKMSDAQSIGLMDTLVYRIDLDQVLASMIYDDKDMEIEYLRVEDLLPLYQEDRGGDEIALIYAEGNIIVSSGEEDDPFATQKVITERVVEQLREAREDEDIKAVVLRVNSGGGAVTTSELICHELALLKQEKPVVVSMGDYAASGGYYISSHASTIVANPYTLTGSIGIFGMIPNVEGTMQKLGLKEETVSTSATGSFNISKPMNPKLAGKMQQMIESGYDQFITRVATGRGLTKAEVDSIGQGRVWLGAKALELGLVDKLGGLEVAIQEAARLAELTDYSVVERDDHKEWWQRLFGVDLRATAKYFTMTNEERLWRQTETYLQEMSGVKALPPYDITQVGVAASAKHPRLTIGL